MIEVLRTGFYSTIQDNGRTGYQHCGVPVSGAMDKRAAELANALVGNNNDAAVMEITMSGPKLEFKTDMAIAIAGANITPFINGTAIENNRIFGVKSGDVLSFGRIVSGFRCYLAVSGGFLTPEILGSRSMYYGITQFHNIKKGDILKVNLNGFINENHFAGLKINNMYLETPILDVYKGPEFDRLSDFQKKQLFENTYTVSKENNRMAYQLNEVLENTLAPILTSLVLPGTVQLTPAGKLIVLMRDCQTTGGYPRVLQLSESSIHTLSQKITGNVVNFKLRA